MLEKLRKEFLHKGIINLCEVDDKMIGFGFYSEMIDSQEIKYK